MSPLAVLRPEPGNTATANRIEAAGATAIRLPLFATRALEWEVPDPATFDALILTSANAVRLGGGGIARLSGLPVYAVGEATARAARDAGLQVQYSGSADGKALLGAAEVQGVRSALLLAGRDRMLDASGMIAEAIAVYASDPLPVASAAIAKLESAVALLHSPRAALRLAELVDATQLSRTSVRLAAISAATASAAGTGWESIAVADVPDDGTLIAAALRLAD